MLHTEFKEWWIPVNMQMEATDNYAIGLPTAG
jgi:hypothetical protein